MPALLNRTPYGAVDLPSLDREGRELLVICVSGTFCLPSPVGHHAGALTLHDEQPPPSLEDVYRGQPDRSSLRREGQTAYFRPGTDIYVDGQAWTPRGKSGTEVIAGLRVGSLKKTVRVVGDRRWKRGILGLSPSATESFTSIPLEYERSFGGPLASPNVRVQNPVGCGGFVHARDAVDQPLPNIEDALRPVSTPHDDIPPVGLGPIARSWMPRRSFVGTYDARWLESRAPLWPEDFDTRFFLAASEGLSAVPHLTGGEEVLLAGMSPDGSFAFQLPRVGLMACAAFRDGVRRQRMVLDAVLFLPEEARAQLTWRAAFPLPRGLGDHEYTTIREAREWEASQP
jgi:hypothetical protein